MKQRFPRFIPIAGVAAIVVVVLLGFSAVGAERVKTCEAMDLCLQPLVNQPLELLRQVEVPNVAVPIWLNGAAE